MAEVVAREAPLPSRAERGTWEGRAARRREAPSTDRGWASILVLLLVLFSASIQDEDRDERGEREAEGGAASEPDAGAPASPAPTPNQLVSHPAFRTGVIYIEPELRDEVEAYWKAYAVWERTKQGPPPREPRVNVRVDHEEKPSTAARLREAMAPRKGAAKRGGGTSAGEKSAGEKSGAEKSAGGSPWAADAAAAAAVIDKSALPSAHRSRSEAAEKTDARPGMARRAGTVAAMLALAAGIGAAAMCGAKEKAPVESAARGSTPEAAASGERATSAAADAASEAAAPRGESTASEAAAVAASTSGHGALEAPVERAAPVVTADRNEVAGAARRRPAPEAPAPAQRAPAAQPPERQPSPATAPDATAQAPVESAVSASAPGPSSAAGGDQPRPISEPYVFQPKLKY
ncbi:hypothetical protein WMF45_41560 [Sorangium sp. So ce448]|uniref:hypothetical protein n=1 Tax=Sorangium sp. So ce448 TaxID=3133314 RepID=UPI003F5D9F28